MLRRAAREAGPRASTDDSAWLFVAFIVLVAVEFGGLASMFPPLQTIRFATITYYALLLALLIRGNLASLLQHRQAKLLLALVIMTALSVLWAVVQWHAVRQIRTFVDYLILFALTATLINRQSRADALSWLLLGVSALLVGLNLERLFSSLRVGAFDGPYFMGDENDFAWGLVTMLPLILNLALGNRAAIAKAAGLAGVCICVIGIVGSGSRGAALGLAAAMFYYWLIMSRRKLLGAVAILVLLGGVLAFAPQSYFERLQTVAEYRQDNSAQGRLQVWRAAAKMAVDFPLGVGAGNFSSAYGRYYMPPEERSALTWAPRRWLSAHSIYFKVLGEYGFIGLFMLLGTIHANLRDNYRTRSRLLADAHASPFAATWPALLNMSVVGYAVCGVFLGGLSYPHLFLLSALSVAVVRSFAPAAAPDAKGPRAGRAR